MRSKASCGEVFASRAGREMKYPTVILTLQNLLLFQIKMKGMFKCKLQRDFTETLNFKVKL